jgi:hypothetical protein
MDAEGALADLVEISPQVEAALLFEAGGPVLGAVGVPASRETQLVGAVRELVQAAGESRSGTGWVTQVHASLGASDVFVVGGASGERGIVAVAAGRPAPGLVFHDLKRCLAVLDEGWPQPPGGAGDA